MSAERKPMPMPAPPFLLELDSERVVDALLALQEAGFDVTYIRGSLNRYRVSDKENS